jgi:hypothetical protein
MATGKRARGLPLCSGGLCPCDLMGTSKRAHGSTRSRVADAHDPSWSQGNGEKDASLGGKACGHRVGSVPAREGKAHRFADRARPCAVIDAPIRRRALSDPRRGSLPSVSSIQSSTGEPYSIAPTRDSLRVPSVGVRHEGPPLVRRRVWAPGAMAPMNRLGALSRRAGHGLPRVPSAKDRRPGSARPLARGSLGPP